MENAITYLNNLLKDNDKVVIAVSGGSDSMCLLNLVMSLNKKITIIVCHVNHKVRKESDYEYEYLENYCKDNNFIFEGMEISKQIINNFESEARKIRYEFFEKIYDKYKANYIMTAHHGDDLMETILMRLTRGSNLSGYIGIKKEDGKYIRPLLNETKESINNYINSNNIPFFEDITNSTDAHTRNRYRKNVLPFLKKENKTVHLKYLKFSEELIEYDTFVSNYIESIHNLHKNEYINIDVLKKESNFIQKKIITNEIKRIQKDYQLDVSDNTLKSIMKLIQSKKDHSFVNISNNFIAQKEFNLLVIKKNTESKEFNFVYEDFFENEMFIIKKENSIDTSNKTIRLNSSDLKLPLYIRNYHKDDIIEVKNLGHKKVHDIFNENKIVFDEKSLWPVLTDDSGKILWIPELKKSKFDKDKAQKCDIILTSERKIK